MSGTETLQAFDCEGETLLGMLSSPQVPASDVGVLIIVGGPQYRVGSHRQFTLLARALAEGGHAVLRFDHRGMGDSGGAQRSFEQISADIGCAIDALLQTQPDLQRVVLWGLCDAAAAALLYCEERSDPRVAGLCLLNPWVRTPQGLAQAHVKHYYLQRVRQKEFWLKLLGGGVLRRALPELFNNLRLMLRSSSTRKYGSRPPFHVRMANALNAFDGPVMLILSGQDLTAREFVEHTRSDALWRSALARAKIERVELAQADHTFSERAAALEVEQHCLRFVSRLAQRPAQA